ncbi:MAG: hypothetical protein P8Z79_12250 [Sedimentisphaerales bacterium]|jgi:uncharacterized protein YwgA
MKDYWLAKLIASVDHVDSRKRLQKSIYLLQRSDCPLKCDYLLHYYGPYSFELAGLMDQLCGAKVVEETPEQLGAGTIRYKSAITERGQRTLASFERTERGQKVLRQITPFIEKFKTLAVKNAWVLELGATVGYYYEGDWQDARTRAATFKKISKNDRRLLEATKLAQAFVGTG